MISKSLLNDAIYTKYGDSYSAKIARKSIDVGVKYVTENNTSYFNYNVPRLEIYNEMLSKYDYSDNWYLTKIILRILVKQVLWWLAGQLEENRLTTK